ncbi:hypothetical protein PRIPAC_96893 [Pristionchus pacificus]|uniref:Uncharacterized protein n=1 Tax=Pristionchus pacificus TaxID=54126 RepID=A0A2A6BJX5_PRIPA|nr:hypothetical protein PRIPAC_96893 [Pristionchus pacificus]|eukprot:PDM66126.1 hypothetical protein PRIPAC_45351 [Pristionchus pacificus]
MASSPRFVVSTDRVTKGRMKGPTALSKRSDASINIEEDDEPEVKGETGKVAHAPIRVSALLWMLWRPSRQIVQPVQTATEFSR